MESPANQDISKFVSLLPTDVQVVVCLHSSHLWYWLYRCDNNFRLFSESYTGRMLFRRCFTEKHYDPALHRIIWSLFDIIHRDDDLPAVVTLSNIQYWYQNGELHRDNNKPAVVYNGKQKHYFIHGVYQRTEITTAIDKTIEYG